MKYIFVLGNMRSGTSLVSRVLAQSPTPHCYFEEPFVKLKKQHYLPIGGYVEPWSVYIDDKNIDHHQKLIEKFTTDFSVFKKDVVGVSVVRNSGEPQYYLIKEVHNIPAFSKIIDGLDYKIVFVKRDPSRILDSNFYNFRVRSVYKDEYKWLKEVLLGNRKVTDKFYSEAVESLNKPIADYIRKSDPNSKEEYIRFFFILLFNQFLLDSWNRNRKNSYMVEYENLCSSDKIKEFKKIFDFAGFVFNNGVVKFINKCSEVDDREDPYSISRNSYLISDAKYKYLTDEQIKILKGFYEF